ncbi:MAG TPA: F0F1 ATP synthase subunit A [Phycisphaerae bacterium]|nr:F0F1 ATP synthase subunit A [Phycisphaerae bacterium]
MTGMILADSPLEHVVQHSFVKKDWSWLDLMPNWDFLPGLRQFSLLSDHIIMQIIAALLVILVMTRAAKYARRSGSAEQLKPTGLGNFIEVICELLRNNVARPALGPYTDTFVPYIWTAFFFVLFSNMLGLVPLEPITRYFFLHDSHLTHGHGVGGTSTGNIFVTMTLAVFTLAMIVINGLRLQGMTFVKHFFQGPFPISLLIAFLEVVGLCAKTFALMMRLFANMVAGHVLLAVLLSFIALSAAALGSGVGAGIGIVVVLGSVAINCLELFVAFLQAFIFTFLTAMFIGQAVNISHGHDEHHDHAEGHHAH